MWKRVAVVVDSLLSECAWLIQKCIIGKLTSGRSSPFKFGDGAMQQHFTVPQQAAQIDGTL